MYVIKENLLFGEEYLSYTVSEKASGCYGIFTGTEADGSIEELNRMLLDRYGIVNRPSGIMPVYEITSIIAGRWYCPKCGVDIVQNETDLSRFHVVTADGDKMGEVFRQDIGCVVRTMDLLDSGGCPVCGRWSDGGGNICSPDGWGSTEFFFQNCRLITRKN